MDKKTKENNPGDDKYCAIHPHLCDQMEKIDSEIKKRLPIWAFTLIFTTFITVLGSILAYTNYQAALVARTAIEANLKSVEAIEGFAKETSMSIKKLAHHYSEFGLNQRRVLKNLNLEYEEIPSIEDYNYPK